MKVRVLDRILILLVALVFLALAAGLVLYAWNLVPASTLSYFLEGMQGYWINTILFSVAALALVLVALRLFVSACRRDVPEGKRSSAMIAANENGAVTIALSTVQTLSKQYILTFAGVRTAHVWTKVGKSGNLTVTVKIAVAENVAIPELTRAIQAGLSEQLVKITGLTADTITIQVDNSIAPKATTTQIATSK